MATTASGFGEGPLDQNVLQRYYLMFSTYEFGGGTFIDDLRRRISAEIGQGAKLRPDAAHLLLVLADQMLLRPYAAPMETIEFVPSVTNPAPPLDRNLAKELILGSFDVILRSLDEIDAPRPRSAHSVMRAIDLAWPILAKNFGWA